VSQPLTDKEKVILSKKYMNWSPPIQLLFWSL